MKDHETWKVVLQAVAIVVGAVFSIFQVLSLTSKPRSTLKVDLEILKLLDVSNPHYQYLQNHINEEIRRTYVDRKKHRTFRVHSWEDFIFGVVLLFAFSVWTLYLLRDGFDGWEIATGLGAFVSLGGIVNGLDSKHSRKSNPSSSDQNGAA